MNTKNLLLFIFILFILFKLRQTNHYIQTFKQNNFIDTANIHPASI